MSSYEETAVKVNDQGPLAIMDAFGDEDPEWDILAVDGFVDRA